MERNYKRLRFVPVRKFTPGLICSIVLMLIMMAVFSIAAAGLSRTAAIFCDESRAVLVMDNTMERIGLGQNVDAATAERIFKEEFIAAGFKPDTQSSCQATDNGQLTLRIVFQREEEQRLLAEVTVSCRKK